MLSRLPTPYQSPLGHGHHQTSIPTPLSLRHNQAGTSPLKCQSANSSRSTSPSHSFIPTPRSGSAVAGTRISLNEKQLAQSQQRGGAASRNASATSNSSTGPASPYGSACNNKNNSMLDKLKLFNPKDKPKPGVGSAKRTSSSSGFSSARSERSDSSASLCSDLKPRQSASNTSGGDKKEGSQNDLNRTSGGGRKKVVKVETKLARPTRGSTTTASRPSSTGSTQQSQGESPPQQHLTKVTAAAAAGQTHSSPSQHTVNSIVNNRIEDKSASFELTTDYHNPPPPPAPSSNTMENDVGEPLRVAGGGTSIPKVTNSSSTITTSSHGGGSGGIPKPTAVVKGYSKPTHTVAPMPPVQHNNLRNEPIYASLEKQKLQSVLETSHERQNSIEEVEEAMSNVKPMQPLLPGYNKRTIAIAPRTIPLNRNRGYRPLDTYPRSNTERNFLETDYSNISSASGYMSDGEVLQSKCNDIPDGYMSEGGASLYQRIQDKRGIKSGLSDFAKGQQASSRSKHDLRVDSKACQEAADETDLVDLSGTDATHQKRRVLNGSGGSSGCVGPVGRSAGGEGTIPLSPAPTASHQPHPVVYRVVGSRHVKKADSGQQTDNSAFRQVSSNQWKGSGGGLCRGDSRGEIDARSREKRSQSVANGIQRKQDKRRAAGSKEELDIDYCNGDRPAVSGKGSGGSSSSSGGSSSGGSKSSSKTRGVPPTFGYVKRPSSGTTKDNGTVQSQPIPRTKVKVSGGTQTEVQYSVTAAQLSAGVRERLMMSPKTTPMRQHPADTGSLSDSNYAEIPQTSPYGSWLRHSGAYTASLPTRTSAAGGSMIEAESIESLPAQLHHRASLTHARLMGSAATAPRLSRSNSIRSTKSEKLYPSMFQRSEEVEPYYSIPYNIGVGPQHHHSSQPTSPTPSQVSHGTPNRFNYPISPISSSPSSHGINRNSPYVGIITKMNSKDDDVHGSAVSLVSTTSSLYSTPEEKQAHEVRKLRKELSDAQEKVHSLTNQLSTNAHVVSAFEQSLSNMTQRLQQLTATAEKKDSELLELRQTIELLRKQSVEAGLTSQNLSPSLARRHTINTTDPANESNIARQLSTDSVSSLNSLSSACSLSSTPVTHEQEKKKKRGWLRSSFNKAFSRTKKNRTGSISSGEADDQRCERSAPSSPLLGGTPSSHQHHQHHNDGGGGHSDGGGGASGDSPTGVGPRISGAIGSSTNGNGGDTEGGPELVEQLRRQLREKDLVLTDIRLEALSSAHQLESLKDTVIKMRNEMVNLKQDNERLQRLVTSKSLTSSQSSLPRNDSLERRFSMNDAIPDCKYDLFSGDPDGKRVTLSVYLGCHGSYHRYVEDGVECPIASLSISGKTKWDMLDAMIRRAFKDYIERIDPCGGGLGLGVDSIWSYHVGEVVRYKDGKLPELLPCGYLVGDTCEITVCLKGALHSGSLDALVFDTLVPKSILQRYVSLLTEYRRIILCGSSGTGKSYLASKLAEFLAIRAGKESTAESVATFNVEHKSSKELRQYLANIAEQCETNASDLPSVIILDNLHQASSLGEVFNGFLNARYSKCPYIIGTMNQATCSTTNLQLHHNFRWILCANHMEPVKGFLARYLKRKLLENEAKSGCRNPELARITDWVPRAWQHLNQFLEAHSSSDVTIGPRLFVSCPTDVDGSQVWFTDLWNYSVVPYLLEAVREGLQVYGRRAPWEDPTQYICQTYPWAGEAVHGGPDTLIRLRPEDVGYEIQSSTGTVGSMKSMSSTQSEVDGDPLLNMLMRLQEAANYTSPHGNDSDSNTNEALNGLGVQSTL